MYLESEEQEGQWASQLELENNRISIKYNLLGTDSFDLVVTIDGRNNIGQLREAIKGDTGITGDLVMKRGNRIGQELKNEKSSIQDCNIINFSQIFLEKGQPCNKDQVRVVLFLARDASL